MARLGTSVGRYNKWVTLSQCPQPNEPDADFFEDLEPAGAWAAIRPQGMADLRTISHQVEMRHHPQVTVDTRIIYEDPDKPAGKTTRQLFVKSVQNIDEMNDTLILLCEEVVP